MVYEAFITLFAFLLLIYVSEYKIKPRLRELTD